MKRNQNSFRCGVSRSKKDEVLEKVFVDSKNLAEDLDFLWHGGEPLLAGLEHFRKAVTIQQEVHFPGRVRNMIQTNATLLDEEMCQFFAENKFLISTSLDGPPELNDINRCSIRGLGTHDAIVEGVRLWRMTGNRIGAVALATKTNVQHP